MLRDNFSEFKANDNAAEETDMVSWAASCRDWQKVSVWEEGKEGREGERERRERREGEKEGGRAESEGREGRTVTCRDRTRKICKDMLDLRWFERKQNSNHDTCLGKPSSIRTVLWRLVKYSEVELNDGPQRHPHPNLYNLWTWPCGKGTLQMWLNKGSLVGEIILD